MTKTLKSRKLSHEILGLIAVSAGISLLLFLILSGIATAVAENYCFQNDIPMTEFDWIEVDRWIFGVSAFLSCCSFSILFLFLLGDRIAYIRKITSGIDALHDPADAVAIPLEGNNELTQLAQAINNMAQAQQQLREKERSLAQEKEELIRTLSHDIRTPLTSILAYSDFIAQHEEVTLEDQKGYVQLIRSKAEQIRDLTAILLDGTQRKLEQFDDGRLLMEQITAEFKEELEERFDIAVDLSACPAFSAQMDVQELRRIFDNLSSNVRKYADPHQPVRLKVSFENGSLLIDQTNGVLTQKPQSEGYQIGLNSIRRVAQLYGGTVAVEEDQERFHISVIFRNL